MKHPNLCCVKSILPAGLLVAALHAPAAWSATTVQAGQQRLELHAVAQGLEEAWGLAFLPDGRLLVTEKPGRLRMIAEGRLLREPVAGLPAVAEHGQGGLLDVAVHPRFHDNRWVYLSYAAEGKGGYGTEVYRARLDGMRLRDGRVIFRQAPKLSSGRHFGSRLLFGRDGYLYVTLGDRGDQDRAQRLDQHVGKVVRLHDDGRVPAGNPFLKQPGALPEIYSYGHRNVQGAALHPQTGAVWTHEHGPQGGDEINILHPGTNYGWPVITYGVNYVIGTRIGEGTHKAGMAQPLHKWVPSIAPSGMAFYDGEAIPAWRGSLFVGSLKFRQLVRLTLDGERVTAEEHLLDGIGRVRDVRAGPDGLLYLLVDGRVLRLQPVR